MALTRDGYMPRLIDEKIARYLKILGAVSIPLTTFKDVLGV